MEQVSDEFDKEVGETNGRAAIMKFLEYYYNDEQKADDILKTNKKVKKKIGLRLTDD
jgi:hypothetical protein